VSGTDYPDTISAWLWSTLLFVLLLVLAVWGLVRVTIHYDKVACRRAADGYGLAEWDHSITNGCRVKLDNGILVPRDSFRFNENGGLEE
jgi:hypothetical protein